MKTENEISIGGFEKFQHVFRNIEGHISVCIVHSQDFKKQTKPTQGKNFAY